MDDNKDNFGFGENMPDPSEFKEQHDITEGSETLEPLVDEDSCRKINADDPEDLAYWANQFQISVEDLKSAVALNGNVVADVKKYLSV